MFDNKGLDTHSVFSKKSQFCAFFWPGNDSAAEKSSQHCIDNVNEFKANEKKTETLSLGAVIWEFGQGC